MGKGLTFTVIFRGNSLNYGEGIANIAELKKIHRGNGDVLTFASRQSIRYDIVRLGNEWFDWNIQTVDKTKGTLQFKEEVSIVDSVEMDLFGYLKTAKKGGKTEKRAAVARLSHAVSLEPYRSDMEFLNNMGLAERINETPNLANVEQHESFYSYTITLDLNKLGIDKPNEKKIFEISNIEKIKRVHEFLDVIKLLNRNIRGRQETLAPLFIIGGIYPLANPFFLGRVMLEPLPRAWELKTDSLKDVGKTTFGGEEIKENTHIGYVSGIFRNENKFDDIAPGKTSTVEDFFVQIKNEIQQYFGARV